MVIYCTNSSYIYAMVGDPSLSQHGGHAYPCTNAEGLFITDADKRLSDSLPFNSLSLLPIFSLIFHPQKYTHILTDTCIYVQTVISYFKYIYVGCKVWISAIHGLCCANHGSILCETTHGLRCMWKQLMAWFACRSSLRINYRSQV